MGAAVAVEMHKPLDASEIRGSGSLLVAKAEIVRLRGLLGHLAKDYGIDVVVYDASDIVLGKDEDADFERCIKEIVHIRSCLQLNTQNSKRVDRKYSRAKLPVEEMEDEMDTSDMSMRESEADSAYGSDNDSNFRHK